MATPKNYINSVVYAKPGFSQADGLPRFYTTVDLQGGNIENVTLINGELPMTIPPTGGFVRYDACDGAIYDISVNLMDGVSNIQLGYQTGDYGTGSRNVMLGYFAANGTGTKIDDSVAIGTQAGVNADGSNNVMIGPYTGYYTGGSNNIFIGKNAGYDMSGVNNNNIFLGRNAGEFMKDISDTFIIADASNVFLKGHMVNNSLELCNVQFIKNGSVGINNSNPDYGDYKLDVSGAAIVRGNLDICGNFYVSGNIIYDGSGVNVDISNGGLTLLGTGAAPATLQVRDGGVTINNDGTQGAYMTIGYALDYTRRNANYMIDCSGNIATTGRMGFSGVSNTAQTNLTANISCPSSGALAFNTNSTEAVRITSSGNVGIAKTNPAYKLDISGQTNIFSNGGDALLINGSASNISLTNSDTTTLRFTPVGGASYIESNGNILFTGPAGGTLTGNVGIAKTNPTYVLDVCGDTQITGNIIMSPTTTRYTHMSIDGGNSYGFLYGAYNANLGSGILGDGIHLGYNFVGADDVNPNIIPSAGGATSRLTVGYGTVGIYTGGVNLPPTNLGYYQIPSGNVGIGTTTPAQALDVSGNLRVYNSIKTTQVSSQINGPYYSFKYVINTTTPAIQAGWADICSPTYSLSDYIYTSSGNSVYSYLGGSSPSGAYTAPVSGIYYFGFFCRTSDSPSNTIFRIANSNGSTYPFAGGLPSQITGSRSYCAFSTTQYLNKGEIIKVQGDLPDGGDADIQYFEFYGNLLHSV